MAWLRRLGVLALVGFVLGVTVASLVAPPYLAWYSTPGAGQALCNCVDVVKNTASSMLQAQLIGAGIGAFLGALLALWWRPKPAKAAEPSTPAPNQP